jgi:ATP-dependent DNA ligase
LRRLTDAGSLARAQTVNRVDELQDEKTGLDSEAASCTSLRALPTPRKLLAECEKRGLEGIVSKRLDAPYRSGKCDWIKVKTPAWRAANKNRDDLFRP